MLLLFSRRRVGRYDLSRDLFVISVRLPDGQTLQCTLSHESVGKECLDYVCQRLELKEAACFGLRYRLKRLPGQDEEIYRWVELDRPLSKQLERSNAEMPHLLHFDVEFYTRDMGLLSDRVARFYYFLHVKLRIIDGKLNVSAEKAILLASYSLQGIFGDFDEAKHTLELLKKFALLPKYMTNSEQILEDLLRQVMLHYRNHHGLNEPAATKIYLSEAFLVDGYGKSDECFAVKDSSDGSRSILGYSIDCIFVKTEHQSHPQKIFWKDVQTVSASKRNFCISCYGMNNVYYQMDDSDTAKYCARICTLQLRFYREYASKVAPEKALGSEESERREGLFRPLNHSLLIAEPRQNSLFIGASPNGAASSDTGDHQNSAPPTRDGGVQCLPIRSPLSTTADTQPSYSYSSDSAASNTRRAATLEFSNTPSVSSSSSSILVGRRVDEVPFSQISNFTPTSVGVNGTLKQVPDEVQTFEANHFDAITAYRQSAALAAYHATAEYVTAMRLPPLDEEGNIGAFSMNNRNSGPVPHACSNPDIPAILYCNDRTSRIPPPLPPSTSSPVGIPQRVCASTPDLSAELLASRWNSSPNLLLAAAARTFYLQQKQLVQISQLSPIANTGAIAKQLAFENLSVENLDDAAVRAPRMFSQRADDGAFQRQFNRRDGGDCQLETQPTVMTNGNFSSQYDDARSPVTIQRVSNGLHSGPSVTNGDSTHSSNGVTLDENSVRTLGYRGLSHSDLHFDVEVAESNDERLAQMELRVRQGVAHEFEQIAKKRASAGVSTALRPENTLKNRYSKILPYEDTRFVLRATRENPSGYINASSVRISFAELTLRYVATQTPLAETEKDFWQMIYESAASIVISLSNGSTTYWPSGTKLKFGDFQIVAQLSPVDSAAKAGGHMTSCATLKHLPTGEKRQIYHLQYLDWPDGGSSEDLPTSEESFLAFLDEVKSVKRHAEAGLRRVVDSPVEHPRRTGARAAPHTGSLSALNGAALVRGQPSQSSDSGSSTGEQTSGSLKKGWFANAERRRDRSVERPKQHMAAVPPPPLVVQCASGAGRTGVFLLTEMMIYCLEHNHKVDVNRALLMLRQQRMQLVESAAQYRFVYSCLMRFLRGSRLI